VDGKSILDTIRALFGKDKEEKKSNEEKSSGDKI
jgi:hypothetical protein